MEATKCLVLPPDFVVESSKWRQGQTQIYGQITEVVRQKNRLTETCDVSFSGFCDARLPAARGTIAAEETEPFDERICAASPAGQRPAVTTLAAA